MPKVSEPTNIADLMKHIELTYVFTAEHYPELAREGVNKEVFALRHLLHHIQKSVGRLAAECERFDHGDELNDANIREVVVKILINVLKLAAERGISAKELVGDVPAFMKST